MKKYLLVVILLVVCFIFSSCESGSDSRLANVTTRTQQSTETALTIATEKMGEVFSEGDIEWLKFSSSDYQKEREAIRDFYKEFYDAMKRVEGDEYIEDTIYIAKKDLDRDGENEIIAYMYGILWSGSAGSSLKIMEYDGEKVAKDMYVVHVRIDSRIFEIQNTQIGMKENFSNSGYGYDFVFTDSKTVWSWNNIKSVWYKKYDYSLIYKEEPNDTTPRAD